MKIKESNFVSNILNGLSIGIVITLIPSAILGSLMRIFGNDPAALAITQMTSVSQSLLAVVSAYAIAHFFKFSSIDSGSLMLAAFAGSGAYTFSKGTVILSGPGDIINIGLTIALSSLLIFLLKDRLGQLKVIFSPILVLSLGGGIGRLIFLSFIRSLLRSAA
ncbi:hypothetical protein Q757_06350 [Oenococcus alcoholitolerans]|uniref:Phosphotransferase system EIIC domain-containing protein n=1 Tax=Oenococcus alcoholitolerans TaxID=931074 RepID=A0ABR4XQ45_9LACO|nr:hypothetical protein Q757_06350 [Oenococcus alcoholitolerans]